MRSSRFHLLRGRRSISPPARRADPPEPPIVSTTMPRHRRVGRHHQPNVGGAKLRRVALTVLRRAVLAGLALLVCSGGAAGIFVASVDLPDEAVVPQASVLYFRDGRTVLARLGINDRTDVALSGVPEAVRRAVLAAEDRGFYDHFGVSARGIVRAVVANVLGSGGQGASTITQQYVRNAFLNQERTLTRKGREAALALRLEQSLSKDEILERYLNTIYFGRGAYGVQAAAQAYFGLPVDRLGVTQAAVLAAVIKDPWFNDPAVNPAAAEQRWRWILSAMAEQGWLDPSQAASARYPQVAARSVTKEALSGPLGLIADQVEQELGRHGIASQLLRTGGLRVVTTIDAKAQGAATKAIGAALRGQPQELRAALVALEPITGAVRAYYGGQQGRGFFDDAAAPRPPAAAFMPLALAEGLRQDISYRSAWNGTSPRTFADRQGVPLYNRADIQCPVCPLDHAIVESLNTPVYALAQTVGPSQIRKLAVALGVPERYGEQRSMVDRKGDPTPNRTRADIALGRYPVAPADLATVYGTLAAGGERAERHLVQKVTGPSGAAIYSAQTRRSRALNRAVAADVTTVLGSVVNRGGASAGRPAAVKAGSQRYGDTQDNQDAWTAGYVPQLAAVTWIGRANPGPIRDKAGTPVRGEGMPYAIWCQFLADALSTVPAVNLPSPANVGRTDAGDYRPGAPDLRPSAPTAGARRPDPAPTDDTYPVIRGSKAPASAPGESGPRAAGVGRTARSGAPSEVCEATNAHNGRSEPTTDPGRPCGTDPAAHPVG